MKKKILITGSNGQLGQSLKKISADHPEFSFQFTDVEELNITERDALEEYFSTHETDVLINCAGYTAVDKAEEDEVNAYRLNAEAPGMLASLSKSYNYFFIHISTDFVFGGDKTTPYIETDPVNPLCVYSHTKAEGEKLIAQNAESYLILRTSWLYSEFGHNFLKTMLRLTYERDQLNVVFDQTGTPTYAGDLAEAIMRVLSLENFGKKTGIYHYSNEGVATWYDFAVAISTMNNRKCNIQPITTDQFPLPARRPAYSVLNKNKIKNDFGMEMPYWRASVLRCLEILNS